MTTIAYKDGVMAADTLVTAGSYRDGYMVKIMKNGERIMGMSGTGGCAKKFLEWFMASKPGDEPPVMPDESAGFIANIDGSILYIDKNGTMEVQPYEGAYGIGSGCEYALGAMAAGLGAAEAVAIAIRMDTKSGGAITVLSF